MYLYQRAHASIAIGRARGLSWLLCQSLELLIALVGLADFVSPWLTLGYYYANWLADYMYYRIALEGERRAEGANARYKLFGGAAHAAAGTSSC
jgi:hypothetical protein